MEAAKKVPLSPYTQILEFLKEPIENECYMITTDWWRQWVQYNKDVSHKESEPGSINNYILV